MLTRMLTRKALGNAAIAEDAAKAVAVVAVTTTVEAAVVAVTTTTLVAVATEAVATATTAVVVITAVAVAAVVVAAAVVAAAALVVEKVRVIVTTTTEAAEVEVRTGIIEMIKSETTIKAIRLRTGAATIAVVLTSARGLMVRALVKASSLFAMDAVSSDANATKTMVEGVEKWALRGLRSTMKTTIMKISTSTKAHTAMNSVETADALSSKEDTPRRAVHCCSSTLVRTLSC